MASAGCRCWRALARWRLRRSRSPKASWVRAELDARRASSRATRGPVRTRVRTRRRGRVCLASGTCRRAPRCALFVSPARQVLQVLVRASSRRTAACVRFDEIWRPEHDRWFADALGAHQIRQLVQRDGRISRATEPQLEQSERCEEVGGYRADTGCLGNEGDPFDARATSLSRPCAASGRARTTELYGRTLPSRRRACRPPSPQCASRPSVRHETRARRALRAAPAVARARFRRVARRSSLPGVGAAGRTAPATSVGRRASTAPEQGFRLPRQQRRASRLRGRGVSACVADHQRDACREESFARGVGGDRSGAGRDFRRHRRLAALDRRDRGIPDHESASSDETRAVRAALRRPDLERRRSLRASWRLRHARAGSVPARARPRSLRVHR